MASWKRKDGFQPNRKYYGQQRSAINVPKVFQNPANPRTRMVDSSFTINTRALMVATTAAKYAIGRINISDEKMAEINDILRRLQPRVNVSYENMANSHFKVNFLEKRMVTLEQKMDFFLDELKQNEAIDHELFAENNQHFEDPAFMKMYEKRKKLPAFQKRNQIIKMVQDNQVVLISGETGCGKTTQVPQFLLDDYINGYKGSLCKIICTQPRRISAVSVAERVAAERAEMLGMSVGYQIRLERVHPRKYGSILFVTNGIVIRLMENDPLLNNISHLIIDEIHERDIHSDFLLTLVKQLISRRKDLKVILMSATLNEKRFREYFDCCAHVEISGLSHPVEDHYLEDIIHRLDYSFSPLAKKNETLEVHTHMFRNKVLSYIELLEREQRFPQKVLKELRKPQSEEINLDLIYQLTMHICHNEEEGAILIFVTGFDDINNLFNLFYNLDEMEYNVIALHSEIPMEDQKMVFEPSPPGIRKIIISTNIAETSITIDDVVYVIDCGWSKVKVFDPKTNTENLLPRFISKANATQRKGRAGRLRAGKCFHLYTKARFEAFSDFQKPEILRSRLESIILQMKFLQLGRVKLFFDKMLDQPEMEMVRHSLDLLNELGALDEEEGLTPLGYYLAKLPIAPQLGKMLLLGTFFHCLEPILNIAVCLDYKSPFNLNLRRNNKVQEFDALLVEFSEGIKSDHLLLHKAVHVYNKMDKNMRSDYCKDYNVNASVMSMLKKLKQEFMEYLFGLELVITTQWNQKELNINSNNIELIKSIVCAGLYPNIIVAGTISGQPKVFFKTLDNNKVFLHKKSILSTDRFFSNPLLAYYIKRNTKLDMVHDATVCSPLPVIFFSSTFRVDKSMHENYLVAKELKFSCSKTVSAVLEVLRERLHQFLLFRLTHPTSMVTPEEELFIKVIVDLLASPEGV